MRLDHLKGHMLILEDTAYTTPLLISRAILVKQDSLTIKVTGKLLLKRDQGYANEAIRLSPTCKKIVLDSLSISGFHTGIISYNNALVLKNTRFISCSLPVLNAFTFTDKKYVNGKMTGTPFKTDSIPLKTK